MFFSLQPGNRAFIRDETPYISQGFNIVLQEDFFKFPLHNFCKSPGSIHRKSEKAAGKENFY